VEKIKIIKNTTRLKREVGNEGEEGVERIFNNRKRNGGKGAGRRVAGREGSTKKRRLTKIMRRMRKQKSIRIKRRRIRTTTRKRGGREKVKILKLSRRIEVRGEYVRKISMWRSRTKK
jgi:hypothetical protein